MRETRVNTRSVGTAWHQLGTWLALALAPVSASLVPVPVAREPVVVHPRGQASRKGSPASVDAPLLGTLADTHSPRRIPLDDLAPTAATFETLLADPVVGTTHPLDPTLLRLLREIARRHPLARIDIVSGFRSPKLNEALRKKGHHVASHSQHSLGHAVDFRVIPEGEPGPMDPRALAAEVRALGWSGGVGTYPSADDRFVHADVGPLRAW